jgi:hypothetical protein
VCQTVPQGHWDLPKSLKPCNCSASSPSHPIPTCHKPVRFRVSGVHFQTLETKKMHHGFYYTPSVQESAMHTQDEDQETRPELFEASPEVTSPRLIDWKPNTASTMTNCYYTSFRKKNSNGLQKWHLHVHGKQRV